MLRSVLIIGGVVWFCVLFFGLLYLFRLVSGWGRLACYFRAPGEPLGFRLTMRSIRVGAVRYRFTTTIVISQYGLYLRTGMPFHPPLLIPWQAVTAIRGSRLYWFPAFTLSIGEPRLAVLTLHQDLFPQLQQFLPPGLLTQA
jgi:hypothetical protein